MAEHSDLQIDRFNQMANIGTTKPIVQVVSIDEYFLTSVCDNKYSIFIHSLHAV